MRIILDIIDCLSPDTEDDIRALSAKHVEGTDQYSIGVKRCLLDVYRFFKLEDAEKAGDKEFAEMITNLRNSMCAEEVTLLLNWVM